MTGKIEKSSFNELKNDKEFIGYLMSDSSSKESILNRIKRAEKIILIKESGND